MKRVTLLAMTILIGVTSTAVIATAKGGPGGQRGGFEQMFENFDTDSDGALTRAEIIAGGAARFAAADTNGDGLLSAEEMAAAGENRDSERRTKRIESRIERLDTNGDGQLSLEEVQANTDRLDRLFDRLDADDNGTITKAEAEAAKSKRNKGQRDNE